MASPNGTETPARRRLPRRDLVILPLLALATVLVLFGAAEVFSRVRYPEREADSCKTPDAVLGYRFRPGCTSTTKAAEGPWTTNGYNACGYRTPEPCGPVPAGARRIALIGSSTSSGYLVPYGGTLAAHAAADLTQVCRRPVEVQNLGGVDYTGAKLTARARESLTLAPQALVLVVSPLDLELAQGARTFQENGFTVTRSNNPVTRLKEALGASRAASVAQHFVLKGDRTYVPTYLRSGDRADFMRAPLPEQWRARVAEFDGRVAGIQAMAARRRVPFVIVFAPQRAQAGLVAGAAGAGSGALAGFDALVLPRALAAAAAAHGAVFVDSDAEIAPGTPTERLFYPVNGHPNAEGHRLIARSLVRRLLAPDLAICGA